MILLGSPSFILCYNQCSPFQDMFCQDQALCQLRELLSLQSNTNSSYRFFSLFLGGLNICFSHSIDFIAVKQNLVFVLYIEWGLQAEERDDIWIYELSYEMHKKVVTYFFRKFQMCGKIIVYRNYQMKKNFQVRITWFLKLFPSFVCI